MAMEEETRLRATFAAVDLDGDGWIAAQEFALLLRDLDEDLSEDECLLAFDAADDDADGRINFAEFVGWWTDR
jgi:Ca2+-binding EF-hand superfamily protein